MLRLPVLPVVGAIAATVPLIASVACGGASRAQGRREHINPSGLSSRPTYTHVVTVRDGTLIFVSGQVAVDEGGRIVGQGDLAAQARQVFQNLGTALAAAGAAPGDVVKVNTYVVGLGPDTTSVIGEVRREFFGNAAPPASTIVGVQRLAREDFLVEVEAVALRP